MGEPAQRRMSYAEYLALERESDVRHEFLDGDVVAMAGGTPRHSGVKTNLAWLVMSALRGTPCRAYDADLKVRVPATGIATYPDLAVVCSGIERDNEDPNAVTNPTVLFEVLSKDSERWDRGGKFAHYRQLPSLRHYLLVSQVEPRVEHFAREADGSWRLTVHGPGERVQIATPEFEIAVDDLYVDLPEVDDSERGRL